MKETIVNVLAIILAVALIITCAIWITRIK